ncbi:uncharacterized protein L201_004317 [Kwoniella dendrophila CBS 6074]|uniref:PIN domain-containing protein n=1 Tax=Kwoniella dendrophila CBS 6074 TaxID=1295534 RepID=A0AAX4JX33_9TREE
MFNTLHDEEPNLYGISAQTGLQFPSSYNGIVGNIADDQNMIVSHEEEMIWEPECPPSNPVHYLAIDTNVFISQLNLIRTIHSLLLSLKPSPVILLIPSVVIHELDGLKNSRTLSEPESPITLGRLVQSANSWLLEIHRNRRMTGNGALRCQSIKEKYDPAIRNHGQNDDQILDCCLYFANTGSKVTLWTNDKNLGVKAESNDIPTLGGDSVTLKTIVHIMQEDFPEPFWREIERLSSFVLSSSSDSEENHKSGSFDKFDHDMDMDMDMNVNQDIDVYDQNQSDVSEKGSCSLHSNIRDMNEEERRYPYLLPSTNPQQASTSTPSITTTPPPSITPWQQSSPLIPQPFQLSATQQRSTSISPIPLSIDCNSSTSSSTSANSPITIRMDPSPTSPPAIIHPSPTKIPISRQQSSTRSATPSILDFYHTTSLTSTRTPTPTPTTTKSSVTPSNILLTSIQLSFRPCLKSLLEQCPIITPHTARHSIETSQVIPILLESLVALDKTLEDQRVSAAYTERLNLLKSISSLKNLIAYIDFHTYTQKGARIIRSGEIVENLLTLQRFFGELGVYGGGEDLLHVIDQVRELD